MYIVFETESRIVVTMSEVPLVLLNPNTVTNGDSSNQFILCRSRPLSVEEANIAEPEDMNARDFLFINGEIV